MPKVSLVIRECRDADEAAVGALLVDAFVTKYAEKLPEVVVGDERRRDLLDVRRKRGLATVLLAERDGEVLGTVTLYPPAARTSETFLPDAANLRYLATHPKTHGQGISRALLDETERLAFEVWGAAAICLHVRRGAVGVAGLYQRRGYLRAAHADLDSPAVFLEGFYLPRPG